MQSSSLFANLLNRYRLMRFPTRSREHLGSQQTPKIVLPPAFTKFTSDTGPTSVPNIKRVTMEQARSSLRKSNMYLKYQIRNVWSLIGNNNNSNNTKKKQVSFNVKLTRELGGDLHPIGELRRESSTSWDTLLNIVPFLSNEKFEDKTRVDLVQQNAENSSFWSTVWSVLPFGYSLKPVPIEEKYSNLSNLYQLHVYNSGKLSEPLSFSFASCGLLMFYELGAALAIQQIIQPLYLRDAIFVGTEAGSISAATLALNLDADRVKETLLANLSKIK